MSKGSRTGATTRRRATCPACGREASYTYPHRYSADRRLALLRVFTRHKDPVTGLWCDGRPAR